MVFLYDGTFEGFLTCVFISFQDRLEPMAILPPDAQENLLFESREIRTDESLSNRVRVGIERTMGTDAFGLVAEGFLTCLADKERKLLELIRFGMKRGKKTLDHLAHPSVHAVLSAVNHMHREAHLLKGFIRFEQIGDCLVAKIEPKNFALPLLGPHFADRLSGEKFAIFDLTHSVAWLYADRKSQLVVFDNVQLQGLLGSEVEFQQLWKGYYDAMAIAERINPTLRRGLMPKRYWAHMTEMQEAVNGTEALPEVRKLGVEGWGGEPRLAFGSVGERLAVEGKNEGGERLR